MKGMRRLTRAQEKTTRKHSESQLPFYCLMIVVQNCPHAPGLVWLWHTPQMALQLMGEHYLSRTLPWSCFSNSHNNRTLFSTERGATSYLKPTSSFTHDCVCQPSHRTAQSTMGPSFTPPPRQFMNTGHARTFITVIMLTGAQSEPGQIWTYGYKHCDEHCISYRS